MQVGVYGRILDILDTYAEDGARAYRSTTTGTILYLHLHEAKAIADGLFGWLP